MVSLEKGSRRLRFLHLIETRLLRQRPPKPDRVRMGRTTGGADIGTIIALTGYGLAMTDLVSQLRNRNNMMEVDMNSRIAALAAIGLFLGACAEDQRGAAGGIAAQDMQTPEEKGVPYTDPEMAVGAIVGRVIVSRNGEELGDVDDVVRDRVTNHQMVVVDLKTGESGDTKEVVVPLDQIKTTPDGSKLQIQMTREQLEARPAYDRSAYVEDVQQSEI